MYDYHSLHPPGYLALSQRLAAEPTTTPDPSITELLLSIAKRYPQVFFKPLFLCAASNKELTITNYLRILITLSAYLPNILTSNAEMMSVALMGNLSNTGNVDETVDPTWEQARLGHCVILVELISRMRTLRKSAVCPLVLLSRGGKLSNTCRMLCQKVLFHSLPHWSLGWVFSWMRRYISKRSPKYRH